MKGIKPMKFGNAAWGFRETPLEEQFKITADMGLSALEIGIANAPKDIPLDVTDAELFKVKELSEKYGVEMPITSAVNSVICGEKTVKEAMLSLMNRDLKNELNR